MNQRSLLIGCGNSRVKKVYITGQKEWTGELTTLDMNPNCGADVVLDIDGQFGWGGFTLPFDSRSFDELAAYDSLEHWGKQGDWKGWFDEMAEYWRILKPGGTFGIIVPIGADAFADPGHSRFFHVNHFQMLNQQWYADALAAGAQVTDYRWYWQLNFDIRYMEIHGDHHIAVILQKA